MAITTTGDLYLICANGASAGTEQKDLYVSTNGSLSWQHVEALEIYGYADAIIAATPDMLWRDGGRAPIYTSTDAGETWNVWRAFRCGQARRPGCNTWSREARIPSGNPSSILARCRK